MLSPSSSEGGGDTSSFIGTNLRDSTISVKFFIPVYQSPGLPQHQRRCEKTIPVEDLHLRRPLPGDSGPLVSNSIRVRAPGGQQDYEIHLDSFTCSEDPSAWRSNYRVCGAAPPLNARRTSFVLIALDSRPDQRHTTWLPNSAYLKLASSVRHIKFFLDVLDMCSRPTTSHFQNPGSPTYSYNYFGLRFLKGIWSLQPFFVAGVSKVGRQGHRLNRLHRHTIFVTTTRRAGTGSLSEEMKRSVF
jgi:hypothetical protein